MILRVFTAFSGYDSQCLALDELVSTPRNLLNGKRFSYELIGWSEIDKFAIQAHNALFPQWSERNYGDISKIDWNKVPEFDLFTYSSPCQDFSQAGRQAGAEKGSGTRSSLLWECERAIAAKKPKYLLFENVAAVISSKFIGLFNEWQLTLSRMGYTNFVSKLNAKTHGFPNPVPQNRERVFMVSILNCETQYFFPDPTPLRYCIADMLEDSVDESYYLSAERLAGLQLSNQKEKENGWGYRYRAKEVDEIAHTITQNKGRKTDNYIKVVGDLRPSDKFQGVTRQQNFVISSDGVSMVITAKHQMHPFNIVEPQLLGWSRDKKGNVVNRHPVEVANTVTAGKRENTQNYVLQTKGRGFCNGKTHIDSPTITKSNWKENTFLNDGIRIRKLTPRECFRLMGVKDSQIDTIQEAGISKTQQYKLAGNSIVVNCLTAIFRQLFIGNFNKVNQLEVF